MTADTRATIRQITRLARLGALQRAWSLLEQSGLAAANDDASALALRARLKKDRGKRATGSERMRWLEQSAADYLRAFELDHASYPLINAASLSLLAGRRQQAEQLAARAIELIEANPGEAETPYWLGATKAEALLLLGKLPEARAALRAAVTEAPMAWEDRAATIGQFALICDELGCDATWLDQLRPPRSLQYTGIMGVALDDPAAETRIAQWLETENVGFGYGALAAGADIWIAEALLARGAALNVILPCPIEAFRQKSVAAVDPAWVPRFDRLLEAADSVDELDASTPSTAAVQLTDAVSMGLAAHNARIMQSEPLRLRITGIGDRRASKRPSPLREGQLAVTRQSGGRDFHVGHAGAAKAMLRIAGAGDKASRAFDSPAEAWAAAQPLIRDGKPVALDYRFIENGHAERDATGTLDAIADVVEAGQALASKAMAFALLAEAPETRVETIGEIRGANGFFPVYALA